MKTEKSSLADLHIRNTQRSSSGKREIIQAGQLESIGTNEELQQW